MAVNRTGKVTAVTYAGSAKLHGKESNALGPVMVEALKMAARELLKKANIPDMIVTGGAAGSAVTADETGGTYEDMFTIAALANTGGMQTGEGPFHFLSGTLPTNIVLATDYYVIRKTEQIYQMATTRNNALDGVAIAITGDGSSIVIGGLVPFVIPPVFDSSSSGGVTVASANTAFDTVSDAFGVLLERVNAVRAVLGMGSQDEGPGTINASGTIDVIDDTAATTSGDTSSSQSTVKSAIEDLSLLQKALALGISEVRAAVGLIPVASLSTILDSQVLDGTVPPGGLDFTLQGASGTAIANAAAVVTLTSATTGVALAAVDAVNDIFSDNIVYLSDQIDEVTATVLQQIHVETVIFEETDLSAGTSQTFAAPVSGRIRTVTGMVTQGVVAVADNVTSLTINGTAVTNSSLTLTTASSAIGDVFVDGIADTAANIVQEGDTVAIISDGASTTAGAIFWVEITPTDDSLVGTQTAPTAHAGDVNPLNR